MKKYIATALLCMSVMSAHAGQYAEYDEYDTDDDYSTYDSTCPACVCDCGSGNGSRDNYMGLRIYKNEHSAYSYKTHGAHKLNYIDDNFGFGTTVGNRLTDYIRVEYETLYMGKKYTKAGQHFDFDIWANMLNAYMFREFGGAVAPYLGAGLGLTGIWGDLNGELDNTFALSYQAMAGVLFSLNTRIDIDLGVKYVNFGRVEHNRGATRIDATQIYLGGSYKFGM